MRPPLALLIKPANTCAANAKARKAFRLAGSGICSAPNSDSAARNESKISQYLRRGPKSTTGAYRNCKKLGMNRSVTNHRVEIEMRALREVRHQHAGERASDAVRNAGEQEQPRRWWAVGRWRGVHGQGARQYYRSRDRNDAPDRTAVFVIRVPVDALTSMLPTLHRTAT